MQTGQIAVAFVPMLSLCATGAALTQRGFRPALNSLAPLASDLTVPCLVFTTLARTAVPDRLAQPADRAHGRAAR